MDRSSAPPTAMLVTTSMETAGMVTTTATVPSQAPPQPTVTSQPKRGRPIIIKAQPLPVASAEPSETASAPAAASARGRGRGRGGGATGTKKKKDPNAPIAAHSAYKFFYKETAQNVKNHNPGVKFGDVSRIVAGMWEAMADAEKQKYRKMATDDKQR